MGGFTDIEMGEDVATAPNEKPEVKASPEDVKVPETLKTGEDPVPLVSEAVEDKKTA